MKPRISMLTLGVEDLERSRRFYCDGLGLPARPSSDEIAFFETGSTWLALYPREALAADANVSPEGSGFPRFAIAHNVPTREDVDRVLVEAQAAGAALVKLAKDAAWGGYSGYFADPDGFLWEVAWNPHFDLT